jgi:hypothetical protein
MAEAAIFVMLMDDVLVARMASGRSSVVKDEKIDCLRGSDSDTAYMKAKKPLH